MNWKQIGLNFLVMAVVYCVGYFSSYFLSKKWSIKKTEEKQDKK